MRTVSAVLLHRDPVLARGLQETLTAQFRKLVLANSTSELEEAVPRVRASCAIVDMETVSYPELKRLCAEFPGTAFVCIHRLADESMWASALQMGAADCCQSNDIRGIVTASQRYAPSPQPEPAAA